MAIHRLLPSDEPATATSYPHAGRSAPRDDRGTMDRKAESHLQPTITRDPPQTVNRRKVLGLAAVGVTGGYVLSEAAFPSTASAATTTEQGALAPEVVILTDAPTIALDASLGNDFRATIAASRAMGNPTNPADGQKIVLQITQGAAGSNAITWGNAFDFSSGLPQPTLSTAAGQTDLLAFIYNAAMGKWLLAAFVNGFNPTTTTTTPPPAGTYRLFPSTNGPSSAVAYSGSFLAGLVFQVTTGATWLDGFWWWVCPDGQPTSPQKFALWALYSVDTGVLVPEATVTSGPLTPGQWNYVPLAPPVPLAPGACYNVCTGFSGDFPDTNNEFGAGDPYSAGIVNGPLSAFSDQSGSLPAPFMMPQGVFSVAGTDPTLNMPTVGYQSANFWMDLQVLTAPPAGTSYRLWPSYPRLPGVASITTVGYTLANEFLLSQSCSLDSIWFYSGPGATALPTRCAIWDVGTQAEVAGTDNSSPVVVRFCRVGMGCLRLQRRDAAPRRLQGRSLLSRGIPVVPSHAGLLGRRWTRHQRHQRGPARGTRHVNRHQSRSEHLQPWRLGLSAERRHRGELLGRRRGHPVLSRVGQLHRARATLLS